MAKFDQCYECPSSNQRNFGTAILPIGAVLAVGTALCLFAGCKRTPSIVPRIIVQNEPVGKDFWFAAPHILSVTIVAMRFIGVRKTVPFGYGRTLDLQLVEFAANVDNAIAGAAVGDKIRFSFYVDPQQRPRYYLELGRSYIIALRRENGALRSMADVKQLAIRVYSGKHEQNQIPVKLGTGAAIAYVLLTPGKDVDLALFSRNLSASVYDADYYATSGYVAELLDKLRANPDRGVSDHACLATAEFFWTWPKCLKSVLASPDAELRKAASSLTDPRGVRIQLLPAMTKDPLSLFVGLNTTEIADRLKVMTTDSRPEVSRAACGALKRLFPAFSHPNCSVNSIAFLTQGH